MNSSFSRSLFGGTIFLGAFLLFQVQPLIAKQILPWFGGTAAVWTVCMLFFQVALLAGYAWAHWLSKQSKTSQLVLHLALLALSLASLPIAPAEIWKLRGTEDPVPRILGLLASTIGLPYLGLASASPLLQSWFVRVSGGTPWRFFALSNAGSLLGLITYPVLIEPWLTNRQQVWLWTATYALFVLLTAAIAWNTRNAEAPPATSPATQPAEFNQPLCVALAAIPTALLLAVTSHLTENIAAIPFLWVLPLALYLLSFILCFESGRWYRRWFWMPLAALALPVIAFAIAQNPRISEPGTGDLRTALIVFPAAAFAVFMTCHGELAARRPAASGLTSFYLTLAGGGALGGGLIAILAPAVSNGLYDLPVTVALAAGLLVWTLWSATPSKTETRLALLTLAAGLAVGFCYVVARDTWHAVSFARVLVRNFYGALIVYDDRSPGDLGPVRVLRHGAIEHGAQFQREQNQNLPTTYYSHNSGVGLALDSLMPQGPLRVGLVGLGAGTLFAYGRKGDRYSAYEINPAMLNLAASQFTFMSESPAAREIALGDARLSLERQTPRNFDLLALDAFSGDAIPVHLLTREAFALYWRHLKPHGVLAVHVSNKYLSLAPIVDLAAREAGKDARLFTFDGIARSAESSSDWVLVTSQPGFFQLPLLQKTARPVPQIPDLKPWTDDYGNLFRILR